MNKDDSVNEPIASTSKEVPVLPPLHSRAAGNAILVSPRQRGNPLLRSITNVPWKFDDRLLADYVMGPTTCALYLSIRYHNLNPDYIHGRLKALGKNYLLRVLLVVIDVMEPQNALKTLTKISILADLTLMMCRNSDEAGKIIERYKIYENKPATMIMKKKKIHPHSRLVSALTTIRVINKTDAGILISTFGSLEKILNASKVALSLCPGIGIKKASSLYRILHEPFLRSESVSLPEPPSKKRRVSES